MATSTHTPSKSNDLSTFKLDQKSWVAWERPSRMSQSGLVLEHSLSYVYLSYYGLLCLQGPPTISSVSKRKKGDKSKRSHLRSVGELLVIPFLSKFPMPSDGEEASSKILIE